MAERQAKLRAQIDPASVDDITEVLYLATGSGEILQLLPSDAVKQHRWRWAQVASHAVALVRQTASMRRGSETRR